MRVLATDPQCLPDNDAAVDAYVVAICLLYVLEHERVIAQLAQLHDRVHECLRTAFALLAFLRAISQQHTLTLHVSEIIMIMKDYEEHSTNQLKQHAGKLLHIPIQNALKAGHITLDDVLHFVGQLRFDFFLQTP
jgi:hypothetical protein